MLCYIVYSTCYPWALSDYRYTLWDAHFGLPPSLGLLIPCHQMYLILAQSYEMGWGCAVMRLLSCAIAMAISPHGGH